ncbi:hypothetical protein [Sphingopyxis sp. SE2]|uniref:hypothetical protein n=1 Tax=Sphingopyxis sp. SE2 TaxID=1586240 RepID=UPI0028C445CC|nr:hypothetical protein [Sphingopyxis sp. SE2]
MALQAGRGEARNRLPFLPTTLGAVTGGQYTAVRRDPPHRDHGMDVSGLPSFITADVRALGLVERWRCCSAWTACRCSIASNRFPEQARRVRPARRGEPRYGRRFAANGIRIAVISQRRSSLQAR